MTAVTLSTIVLNDAVDPSDYLVLSRMAKYRREPRQEGRVQRVAGGGFRAIAQQGVQETWDLDITRADLAVSDWLEAHIGRVVCIRDDVGRKVFGVYWTVAGDAVPSPRTSDLTLALAQVTWSEAV